MRDAGRSPPAPFPAPAAGPKRRRRSAEAGCHCRLRASGVPLKAANSGFSTSVGCRALGRSGLGRAAGDGWPDGADLL